MQKYKNDSTTSLEHEVNNIEKNINNTSTLLLYSPSKSLQVSATEKKVTEIPEPNFVNQTVIHMSNINKELLLDEKTNFLHQEELFDLNYTFKSQHRVDHVDTNSSNPRRQKPLKCAICDGEFELKTKLQKHIESDHGKKVSLDSI